MIKVIHIFGFGMIGFGLALVGNAVGATIQDNYIGGLYYTQDTTVGTVVIPAGTAHPYSVDVIGTASKYGIDKMEVNIGASLTTVSIFTNYRNYITSDKFTNNYNDLIDLGDLFLSNNGWDPTTISTLPDLPTSNDNYFNGEFWEFALVLDNHTGKNPDGSDDTGGIASLYRVSSTDEYILAENAGSTAYRTGQEVQYNTASSQAAIGAGTWSLFNEGITFTIATDLLELGSDDLGLRWTMTCANDIIEGSVPSSVPEPATMLLFGTGLAGLAGLRAKKRKV